MGISEKIWGFFEGDGGKVSMEQISEEERVLDIDRFAEFVESSEHIRKLVSEWGNLTEPPFEATNPRLTNIEAQVNDYLAQKGYPLEPQTLGAFLESHVRGGSEFAEAA